MTAISRNPSNPNPLQVNKYLLTFARCPNLQYFCQSLTVPGLSKTEIQQTTPFVDTYVPGEKAIYDLLNITFIVDEELTSWLEIHDWIRAMTFPKEFEEYAKLSTLTRNVSFSTTKQPQFSDATLILLSSSFKPTLKILFHDVFPTSLSSVTLSASDTPENILSSDATFRYTYYDIEVVT